ncbi:hypothetical protein QCA50_002844 [Cerrena zonata]|uniref:Uncharacterized protein n=1 Tax=Cerrena zonata TaxID=2478898 RepID=A0AAW0GKV3_9APHY
MGGNTSKPARTLSKTAKPTWSGARPMPNVVEEGAAHARPSLPSRTSPRASETKTDFIDQESKDPQLAAYLNQLGQVSVDHHMKTVRPTTVNQVNRAFQTRLQSEEEARSSRTVHNRLLASSLVDLLEQRKQVGSLDELKDLAKRYSIDLEKMENLARFVNSHSIDQNSTQRTISEDGAERVKMTAEWVDPSFISWSSSDKSTA